MKNVQLLVITILFISQLLSSCKTFETNDLAKEELGKIFPSKLNTGDTIGLIAPGSYILKIN